MVKTKFAALRFLSAILLLGILLGLMAHGQFEKAPDITTGRPNPRRVEVREPSSGFLRHLDKLCRQGIYSFRSPWTR